MQKSFEAILTKILIKLKNIKQQNQECNEVFGIQYSHRNDIVASVGYIENGGTSFGKINGITYFLEEHRVIPTPRSEYYDCLDMPNCNLFLLNRDRKAHGLEYNFQYIRK